MKACEVRNLRINRPDEGAGAVDSRAPRPLAKISSLVRKLLVVARVTLLGGLSGIAIAAPGVDSSNSGRSGGETGRVHESLIEERVSRLNESQDAKVPSSSAGADSGATEMKTSKVEATQDHGEVVAVKTNMQQWAGWGSSTIAQFAEMRDLAKEFGASYYNGGQGSEASPHVAARMGSVPVLLTVPKGVIPAEGGAEVPVVSSNVPPSKFFKETRGYLNGVLGILWSTNTSFVFTRTESGPIADAVGLLPFKPVDGEQHRADVTFINMGKNDGNFRVGVDSTIKRIEDSYNWLSPSVKHVIVIGQFKNVDTIPGSATDLALKKMDDFARAKYGKQFFDLGAYLGSPDVWVDTGIAPTQADLDQQAMGNLAPSLSYDKKAHLNKIVRAAVAIKIREMIIQLGWYEA